MTGCLCVCVGKDLATAEPILSFTVELFIGPVKFYD